MSQPHQEVIERFVNQGRAGHGTNVLASDRDEAVYSTYHKHWPPYTKIPLETVDQITRESTKRTQPTTFTAVTAFEIPDYETAHMKNNANVG